MKDHPFEVGCLYQIEKGQYKALAIEGQRMRIRYNDGSEQATRSEIQARILQHIRDEAKPSPQPQHLKKWVVTK